MEDDKGNEKQALCTQNGWSFAPFAMEPVGLPWHHCPYNRPLQRQRLHTQWCFFLCGEGLGMKSGMCFAGTRRRVHLFAVHVDINFNANHVSSEHWQPLPHEVEYHRGCGGHRQNRRIARVNSHQWSTAPPYADVKREASAAQPVWRTVMHIVRHQFLGRF